MNQNEFGISPDQMVKYMERKITEIKEVEQFLKNKDFDALGNFGHKLKGNGEPFGHKELAILGASLEIFAREKKEKEIEEVFQKIKNYILNYKK